MQTTVSRLRRSIPFTASSILIATLSACGGGGDGSSSAPTSPSPGTPVAPPTSPAPSIPTSPPQAPVTWSGQVLIDQSIQHATVCADLNANGLCDSTEPVSAATGADGAFQLSYQPADATAASAAAAAALLAQIGTNAIDAKAPTATATKSGYVMSAPAGKSGQINPLTTLVQRYMASSSATLAAAEAAVAQQLAISTAQLYDYQSLPPSSSAVLPDNARTAAQLTSYALELGAELRTLDSNAAAESSRQLARLDFTSISDYRMRWRESDGVVNAEGYTTQYDKREGKAAGMALTSAQLYAPTPTANALQLTHNGWNRCDGTLPLLHTRGTPNRTRYCDGNIVYYGFSLPATDISGKSMAEVAMQMNTGITQLNSDGIARTETMNLTPSVLGSNAFPSGSKLLTSLSIQLNQPLYINDTAADLMGTAPTLEALIAARPVSAVNLATSAGTTGLGAYDATHMLRGAFIDASTMQLYQCEADVPAYINPRNCAVLGTSAYTIAAEGGVRVLRLSNFPATTSPTLRGYAEYNGRVYATRQNRPLTKDVQAISYAQRLNGVAGEAMKTALGL